MKTLAELQAIRDKARMQMKMRGDNREAVRVVVGMATCGISAGARPVLNAFVNEIEKRHLENVVVTQTGCIGMCQFEPIVEVMAPGKEKVTYAKVTADKVARIVAEHLVNGNPVMEYTIGNVMNDREVVFDGSFSCAGLRRYRVYLVKQRADFGSV